MPSARLPPPGGFWALQPVSRRAHPIRLTSKLRCHMIARSPNPGSVPQEPAIVTLCLTGKVAGVHPCTEAAAISS